MHLNVEAELEEHVLHPFDLLPGSVHCEEHRRQACNGSRRRSRLLLLRQPIFEVFHDLVVVLPRNIRALTAVQASLKHGLLGCLSEP